MVAEPLAGALRSHRALVVLWCAGYVAVPLLAAAFTGDALATAAACVVGAAGACFTAAAERERRRQEYERQRDEVAANLRTARGSWERTGPPSAGTSPDVPRVP